MPSIGSTRAPVVLLLGPGIGAISGVSAHLKALLRSRLNQDFVLDHFMVGSEGRRETRAGRWLRLLTSPFALASAIRRRNPAIVHLNTSLNAGAFWRDALYMLVARLHGVRVVYQVHGGDLPQAFCGNGRTPRILLRGILALPHAIVVLAETELKAYRSFLPGQRIALIANAIDCSPYRPLRRRETGDQRTLRLVYLGRLAREKGLYELLQGLACALARGAAAHLTIVGSGPEETGLRRTAARPGLVGSVAFIGPAFGDAKAELLGGTDVFVLPSYSEGLPFALLEGMAAGNAVIASRVGAIPDIVLPGLHGILVPPRDVDAIAAAICVLAGDRSTVARMQRACAARISARHSLQHLASGFGELYAATLATTTPALPSAGPATLAHHEEPSTGRHAQRCAD